MTPDTEPLATARALRLRGESEAADCIELLYWMAIDNAVECLRLRGVEIADTPSLLRPRSH